MTNAVKSVFEKLVALGHLDTTDNVEEFLALTEIAAKSPNHGTESRMSVLVLLPAGKEAILLSQAYACSNELVRYQRLALEGVTGEFEIDHDAGDILSDKLDKEVYDLLVEAANILGAKEEAKDLKIDPMLRLRSPMTMEALLNDDLPTSQRLTAAGTLLGTVGLAAYGVGYGITALATMIAGGSAGLTIALTIGAVVVLRVTGILDYVGNACLWVSDKIMALIWPAQVKTDKAEGPSLFARAKAAVGRGWDRVKSFFSFGKKQAVAA